MLWSLLLSCAQDCDCPMSGEDTSPAGETDAPSDTDTPTDTPPDTSDTTPPDSGEPGVEPWPTWDDDFCAGISSSNDHSDLIQRWQDSVAPEGGVVFTGSSSIRRWLRLLTDFSAYDPVQRGFGGALLSEVAAYAPDIVTDRSPRAVVVFAGTNDVAAGVGTDEVVTAYRCLAQRVWEGAGEVPLLFIGITPTPSRWELHETSTAVNEAVAAIAAEHPGLHYIDIPAAFLQTGHPPSESLFVDDMLHLNEAGYALWTAVIASGLAEVVAASEPAGAPADHPDAGAAILIDLGPSNAEDGDHTASPDGFGQHWNNWMAVDGDTQILAGQAVRSLVTTAGEVTGISLVIGGGFQSNGLLNGGLQVPDSGLLGSLAVADATEDFFYVDGPDNPGALTLEGLDPARSYQLELFGSRDWGSEDRHTRYAVTGASHQEVTLQTSGWGLSGDYDGNTGTVATLTGLVPDNWGRLHIDVDIEAGTYAYLNLLRLTVSE